jgi:hypothetical protein
MAIKRKGALKRKMKKQTIRQKTVLSNNIQILVDTKLKNTISFYINKYGDTFNRKLGLTEDDLKADIMEQIWKGLLSHNTNKPANLTTYLNVLIKNRFLVLLKKSSIPKYNFLEYAADVYSSHSIDKSYTETEETGETIFTRRQYIGQICSVLSGKNRKIYQDLMCGYNLSEMAKRHGMKIYEIIKSIKNIDKLVKTKVQNE